MPHFLKEVLFSQFRDCNFYLSMNIVNTNQYTGIKNYMHDSIVYAVPFDKTVSGSGKN